MGRGVFRVGFRIPNVCNILQRVEVSDVVVLVCFREETEREQTKHEGEKKRKQELLGKFAANYTCPILQDVPNVPVLASDGILYDYESILSLKSYPT